MLWLYGATLLWLDWNGTVWTGTCLPVCLPSRPSHLPYNVQRTSVLHNHKEQGLGPRRICLFLFVPLPLGPEISDVGL